MQCKSLCSRWHVQQAGQALQMLSWRSPFPVIRSPQALRWWARAHQRSPQRKRSPAQNFYSLADQQIPYTTLHHPAIAVSLTCSVPASWFTPRTAIRGSRHSLSQVSTFLPGCCGPSMLSKLRRIDSAAVMCRLPSRRWASWAASARSGRLKLSVPCVTNSDSVRPGLSGLVCQ